MAWIVFADDDGAGLEVVKEEHQEFQHAIGALTLGWADLEKVLRRTLRHYAGVSEPLARAIFSGTRASAAMNFMRAIAHNTGMSPERREDLEAIFQAAGAINTMRDMLVHHVDGSCIETDEENPRLRKLSNALHTARIGKEVTYWVSSQTINDMCADCTECCWRLQAHWDNSEPFKPGAGPGGKQLSWRYKPPQPDLTHQPSPGVRKGVPNGLNSQS